MSNINITRAQIESRLRLHIANLCLAVSSKDERNLTLAKNLLHDEVEKMVRTQRQERAK
jgi:hypothetical protein